MHPVIITGDPWQNTWLNSTREAIESFYFAGRQTWQITKSDGQATLNIPLRSEGLLHMAARIASYMLIFPFFIPLLAIGLRKWQGLDKIRNVTEITHNLNNTTLIESKAENDVWKQTKTVYEDASRETIKRTEIGVFDKKWKLFDGSVSEGSTTKHKFIKDQYSETYKGNTYYFGPHVARANSSEEIDLVFSRMNWSNDLRNLEGTVVDTEYNGVENEAEILADLKRRNTGFVNGTLSYHYDPDRVAQASGHPLRQLAGFFILLSYITPNGLV